jgi:hypothetical protein
MKIAKSAIKPDISSRVNRHMHAHAFLCRRLDSAVGFVILTCLLMAAAGSLTAEPPAFITMPSAISPIATSTQAQGPQSASADLNQTAISQIINQLNQRQFQLSAAAAQTSAQRPMFVPRFTTISRAK